MKQIYLLLSILVLLCCIQNVYSNPDSIPSRAVLDGSKFLNEWNSLEEDIYDVANTAKYENYLTSYEKDIFLYLNLARLNPSFFAETYVVPYNGVQGKKKPYAFDERKESLIKTLKGMDPLDLLYPDSTIFEHARCFAIEAGLKGVVGHDRDSVNCGSLFQECCTYSLTNPLDIVLGLLIDPGEKNEDLGHRKTCLGKFGLMGVSIQPHKDKKVNAVLNFGYTPEKIYADSLIDGRFYVGTRDIVGNLQGIGILEQKNGYKYEGYWNKNKMDGYGVLYMKDGCRYEGEWKDSKMHGYGIFYQSDGSWYGGRWIDGEVHGKIVFLTKLGSEYEGTFEKGSLIKEWELVANKKNKISPAVLTHLFFKK